MLINFLCAQRDFYDWLEFTSPINIDFISTAGSRKAPIQNYIKQYAHTGVLTL